ncbi:MAG: thioredoxin family protein [Magnetococcales bacterium]|nr:thioredoxin family protein [Magnetococcales bacterium]
MVLLHTPAGELGARASDFSLMGVDDKQHSLADYKNSKVLVVMFICNHCPYVQAIENRLINLANEFDVTDVAFVGINSNDPVRYSEDSLENMKKRAAEKNYPFAYVVDEDQSVATAYGAVCTPDIFVFNQKRELTYRGRLDDSPRNPSAVKSQDLKNALIATLAGKPVPSPQHSSMGCSIKWLSNR